VFDEVRDNPRSVFDQIRDNPRSVFDQVRDNPRLYSTVTLFARFRG
jgi:hypothetical protein